MSDRIPSVAVLMSTYNGEKYLREQIDSILNQSEVDIQLVIRDDGSADGTKKILQEYRKNKNITIKYGKNLGVGVSFMKLLCANIEADYYAFADQDDIWMEDKLICAVRMLETQEEPALYGSNQMIANENGEPVGIRYKQKPPCDFVNSIMSCRISGCTMVMNRKLRVEMSKKINFPSRKYLQIRIHDSWTLAFANAFGVFIYDEIPHILYRQHGDNVVGVVNQNIAQRIMAFLKTRRNQKIESTRRLLARDLLNTARSQNMNLVKEKILMDFAMSDSVTRKILLLRNREIRKKLQESRLMFCIKVIMGTV